MTTDTKISMQIPSTEILYIRLHSPLQQTTSQLIHDVCREVNINHICSVLCCIHTTVVHSDTHTVHTHTYEQVLNLGFFRGARFEF